MTTRMWLRLALAASAGLALSGSPASAGPDIPVPRFKPVVDEPGSASAPADGAGAAYVAGVDSRGRPVAPAELPRAEDPAGALSGWVTIPVRVRGGPAREVEVEVPLPLPAR